MVESTVMQQLIENLVSNAALVQTYRQSTAWRRENPELGLGSFPADEVLRRNRISMAKVASRVVESADIGSEKGQGAIDPAGLLCAVYDALYRSTLTVRAGAVGSASGS